MKRPLTPLAIVQSGLCMGCGTCAAETHGAQMAMDEYGLLKPVDAKGGERFARTCPFSPEAADEDAISDALYPDTPTTPPWAASPLPTSAMSQRTDSGRGAPPAAW